MQSQATSTILMIRPVQFAFNEETADSNAFQNENAANLALKETQTKALQEFDEMVDILRRIGVDILIYNDTSETFTPDSIFPNNWVSFHTSGKVVLYPMLAENRRKERRMDIIEDLKKTFNIEVIFDFSHYEKEGLFLEGTGSLILDRMHRIAYACLSPRTSIEVINAWKKQMNGYETVVFKAFGKDGTPIYHTNVMMCMGHTFVVICLEAISDLDERLTLKNKLEKTNKHIVEISLEQMENFAGNMLLVKKNSGGHLLVMSQSAYNSLTHSQIQELEEFTELISFDLSMIEACGGGSARCMMAEVHLPKK